MSLIECIPNISEGRRADVIRTIGESVRGPGVQLLDLSSDRSHHRTVLTLAGDSTGLAQAVLALFECAVAAIDLRTQDGVHPRVGAVDVVPFVPLDGATMAECAELARQVGRQVAERFGIPIYLYEEAASTAARARLETIRRGGLAGLADRMGTPGWRPDFGPAVPHPSAGVSVIGARRLLIAYNINLATSDLGAARQIAASVRESGGGLRHVKALGLPLTERGVVQVSMNLTSYQQTSLPLVFDTVRNAAARIGIEILDSEVVGLIPRDALAGRTAADFKLRDLESHILERRLEEAFRPPD